MSKSVAPRAVALIVFLLAAAGGCARAPVRAPRAARPNVLFIISDDLRAELGSYGGAALSPRLDRLAREGVRFDHAYCQYPLCNPSRTSMLTGRYPTTTGVYGNRQWFGTEHPEWLSLPRYFRRNGYLTVRTGKIFHGGIDDTDAWSEGGEARQFEERARPAPRTPTSTAEEADRLERVAGQDRARAPESDRWEAVETGEELLGDAVVADRAIASLRKFGNGPQPFFVACGFSKPHSPLVAPRRFFDLYGVETIVLPPDFAPRPTVPAGFPKGSIRPLNADLFIRRDASSDEARQMIRAYRACVSYVDWNAGRVLDELDRLGLAEDTIVVFWGDHGYQLGEKGKWSKAGSLWEQGARVPLIIRQPRAAGNGRASPRIVQSIDLYPTLVELCGLARPPGLEGRSLRALLANPEAPWPHPAFTVWSERGSWLSGVAIRTERWRYAEFYGLGAGRMLLDPAADPYETANVVDDPRNAPVAAELKAAVSRFAAGKTEGVNEGRRRKDALTLRDPRRRPCRVSSRVTAGEPRGSTEASRPQRIEAYPSAAIRSV